MYSNIQVNQIAKFDRTVYIERIERLKRIDEYE